MSNWGGQPQQQPGYQYPMQTGYPGGNFQQQQNPGFNPNPQQQHQQFHHQQGQNPQFGPGQVPTGNFGVGAVGGIQPQPTGFPGSRLGPGVQPGGFQQQQQQQQGFLQAQPTGFPGQAGGFQQQQRQAPPPPPVPSLPSQFQGQNVGPNPNFLGAGQPPQINRFLSASPGIGGGGLQSQPTGFPGGRPGGGGGLVPQITGYVDPRLQMMTTTFMPAQFGPGGGGPGGGGGQPQLAQPQFNLQQSIQQHNQQSRGSTTQSMGWSLTKAEKKQYNDIFRGWDTNGTGFISGQKALEVFGASGLGKEDLAKIWSLADVNDRGKLNIAEFHVAMGLIYRRLSGNPLPDTLPQELIPPSARDLDDSVDQIKNLLANETRTRSPGNLDEPISRLKARSFNSSQTSLDSGRDATIYKHSDSDSPAGGFYKPRSRHVNRDEVRSRLDEDSPSADLEDMKRRLKSTASMLDRANDEDKSRTREDEELDREMEEMKYRVKRVSEDLEYVSSRGGPKTPARDAERRKLERQLMELTHEKIPELERKVKAREERREREKREWTRERDRANDRFGRFDARDDRDRDRPYSRGGGYDRDDRDRDRDRDRYESRRSPSRDRDRDRDYDRGYGREKRDYDRPRSPPRARSPPPPPPAAEPPSYIRDPPAPPKPAASPAPATKNMTAEERKAFARAEAQRRINARMAALGVTVPSSGADAASPTIDTTVEDRLAQEKKEAEEKARLAEKQAEERERARKERLDSEKAAKEGRAVTPTPTSPKPAGVGAAASPKPAAPPPKVAPTAPKRAPVPPPPRKAAPPPPVSRGAPPKPTPPPVAPPVAPVQDEVDPEEEAIRAKEEALRKQKEARAERLRQLAELERQEREEAEAARLEEERAQERLKALRAKATPSPAPPQAVAAPVVASPPAVASPPPPPPPPQPPVPAIDTGVTKSTNPFSKLIGKPAETTPSTAAGNGSSNPWARPAPVSSPTPPVSAGGPKSYNVAPTSVDDDDWGKEIDDEDSSDEEDTRGKREDIARKLFGGILPSGPTSRPSSAAPPGAANTSPKINNAGPTSAPPEMPSSAFPPPPPPVAPPMPFTPAPAAGGEGGGRNALMASIQGGLKLKPTKTVDKSGPPGVGKVLGDTAPPAHINTAAPPASPPAPPAVRETLPEPAPMDLSASGISNNSNNRQSVGWFSERAADAGREVVESQRLPSTTEEDEEDYVLAEPPSAVPSIMIDSFPSDLSSSGTTEVPDMMADIDKSVEHLARTLYAYEGDGPDDLSFGENLVIKANPSKTGGDWWYGTLVNTGKAGMFPKTYVEPFTSSKAKALYSYTGNNPDELPFMEGDQLTIVDKSDEEWWKAEQGGVVFIVPAAYLEAVEDSNRTPKPADKSVAAVTSTGPEFVSVDTPKQEDMSTPNIPPAKGEVVKHDVADDTESDSDEDDTDTSTSYLSFESDEEPESKADKEARAHERQMVLEAAGLIVTKEKNPPPRPPRPPRASSIRRRRPAPAAPEKHRYSSASMTETKDLPPIPPPLIEEPEPEPDHATKLDDAFQRYESFKQNQANRMSVASTLSFDTVASSPSNASFAGTIPSPKDDSSARGYAHFLSNILGRTKTPDPETGRKTLNISGPISVVNMSPSTSGRGDVPGEEISRSPSPGFGSSWASLVDKSALEGLPSGERKRQEAIFELIATEGAYVRDLQLIVEKFYASMLPLLSSKEVTVIFANIEDILITNTTFLSVLEERQRDCRLYIDRIGDILLEHIPNMASYMAYCVNQGNAIKVLKSLRDSNAELAVHLQRLRDDPAVRNLDLSSYLLVPMQRITRYPLLIKQILHHTEAEGEERKNIERSLDISEKILENINESIRDQEGREKLQELSKYLWIGQGRLDLTAATRYMGPRRLLKEGALTKAKSGRKIYGFLCSDILVLTDEAMRTLYRMPIPLAHAQVKSGKDDLSFEVGQAYPRGGDSVLLKASSPKECIAWMNEVEYAGRRCRHAEDRAMKKQRRNQ